MQIELQIAGKAKRAAKARIRPTNNNTEKAKHKLKRDLPNQRKLLELLSFKHYLRQSKYLKHDSSQ